MKHEHMEHETVSWGFAIFCILMCATIGYLLMDVLEMMSQGFWPW